MKEISFLHFYCVLVICIELVNLQMQPCSTVSNSTTITIYLKEASSEDLNTNPSEYEADIKINGILNGTDKATGISLSIASTDVPGSNVDSDTLFTFKSKPLSYPQDGFRERAYIQLKAPLDRDGTKVWKSDDINVIDVTVVCMHNSSVTPRYYHVIVNVIDINDNTPYILGPSLTIPVNELTPVGMSIGDVINMGTVVDKDTGPNGQVEFSLNTHTSRSEMFEIRSSIRGTIVLKYPLDFELEKSHMLHILVHDRAINVSQRRTSTATFTITVVDGDDLGPVFEYPGCHSATGVCFSPFYKTEISRDFPLGQLSLTSAQYPHDKVEIAAKDQDSLRFPIQFSIVETIPTGFENKFEITNPSPSNSPVFRSSIAQIAAIDQDNIDIVRIVIKATEISFNQRYNTAIIEAMVKPYNRSCTEIGDMKQCGNNAAIVGAVFGCLIAVLIITLAAIIFKLKRQDQENSNRINAPLYQNEGFSSNTNERRETQGSYEDTGSRSPNSIYDELQDTYLHL